jgi:hypothetical protein
MTPAEIGKLTMHDVGRILNHWKRFPPLRLIVAAIAHGIGVKLPILEDPGRPKPMTREEFELMMRTTGGRIDGVGRM